MSKDKTEETLKTIRKSYKQGIESYRSGNLQEAEQEFITALKPLLSKPLMKLIHPENIEGVKVDLLGAMYHLGEIYLRNGDVVREKYGECIDNHSKAAAIFQYCSGFAAKYETTIDIEGRVADSQYFLHRAYDVEREFLVQVPEAEARAEASTTDAGSGSYYENYQQKIDDYKSDLANTRTVVGEMLDDISDLGVEQIAERSAEVEDIYQTSSQFFVSHQVPMSLAAEAIDADLSLSTERTSLGFIQRLLQECYEQLGPVPEGCQHSIIALGSLSLGTMTPWSDLEFAILVNKDRENYKEYFRNLTKLLHIKTINLGETPLQSVGIESLNNFRTANKEDDWFGDDVIDSGFSFDSVIWRACKDPLGRQGGYKVARTVKNEQDVEEVIIEDKPDYELILTPEEMAAMQFAESDGEQTRPSFASDRYLIQALRSNALIDGSQSLLDDYRARLHTEDPEQLQILQSQSMEILKEDIDKFSLKLGDEEEGKLMKVKNGIYRLGDRVVNALANYYGIDAEAGKPTLNVWQKIEAMRDREVISVDGAQHLKEAISIATELRLRTYANNEAQGEGMSTYVPAVEHLTEEKKHQLLEKTFHIKDTSILHHFYYVMLRVQDVVKVFCEQDLHNVAEMILASNDLYEDSNYHKGMVHARFLEYDRAMECIEIAKTEKPGNLQILQDLYLLYSKTKNIDKAIASIREIQDLIMIQNQDNPNHPDIATSYNNLGNAYYSKGDYDAAIEAYKKALEIQLVAYASTPNHPSIAASYNNLGNAYAAKSEYDADIEAHKKALEIQLVAYASTPNHPSIAASYHNLGLAYNSKGEYDTAIECHTKALEIQSVTYASNPNHPDIASSYNNLGNAYREKGEYDTAIEYHTKALEIQSVTYASNPNHPDIAASHGNLGNAYREKGEYDVAIMEFKTALEICEKAYASTPNHPDIAASHGNLGNAYYSKGYYDKAILECNKALEIYEKAYASTPNHSKIAGSYNSLGNAYDRKGDSAAAIEAHDKALEMRLVAYASTPNHPSIADSYNNLGNAYDRKGDSAAAIEYHTKALEMRLVAYASTPNHPSIADSYNNLGLAYSKGDSAAAIEAHDKALEIYEKAYSSTPNHPSIASSYNNLGNAYDRKGDYDAAIQAYNKALEIYEKAYSSTPNHPSIADSYYNLGNVCYSKGDYDAAIQAHNKALEIKLVAYESTPNHPSIASSYHNLGNVCYRKGDYDAAIQAHNKALEIFQVYASTPNHPSIASSYHNLGIVYIENGSKFCNTILVHLGNQEFLADNQDRAREYYTQINIPGIESILEQIDSLSGFFATLQIATRNEACKIGALPAAINCQLVLLKIDPTLQYGNHYHNLACFYAVKGDIEEANQAFLQALEHPEASGGLHAEYAQFLILNRENPILSDAVETISEHLYSAITSNIIGGLSYDELEKNSVCGVLSNVIKQTNAGVDVNPKALAYYLLITHPEYIIGGPEDVDGWLETFRELVDELSDEVSKTLFADAESLIIGDIEAEAEQRVAQDTPPDDPDSITDDSVVALLSGQAAADEIDHSSQLSGEV